MSIVFILNASHLSHLFHENNLRGSNFKLIFSLKKIDWNKVVALLLGLRACPRLCVRCAPEALERDLFVKFVSKNKRARAPKVLERVFFVKLELEKQRVRAPRALECAFLVKFGLKKSALEFSFEFQIQIRRVMMLKKKQKT